MTIDELQIQLDLNADDKASVLDKCSSKCPEGHFFVDSEDGHCYLFDKHGNLDDVNKIKTISEDYIKKDIKKIVIPNGVTSIGEWTFTYCSGLTNVTIPDSVMSIGYRTFSGCSSLMNVTIGNGVTSIEESAFSGCSSLISVTIPDSVKSIGNGAFSWCSGLTSVTIPASVTNIGQNAFVYCSNLKSLIFKDKTIDQVMSMKKYPFGIVDESIIRCEN